MYIYIYISTGTYTASRYQPSSIHYRPIINPPVFIVCANQYVFIFIYNKHLCIRVHIDIYIYTHKYCLYVWLYLKNMAPGAICTKLLIFVGRSSMNGGVKHSYEPKPYISSHRTDHHNSIQVKSEWHRIMTLLLQLIPGCLMILPGSTHCFLVIMITH